MTAKIEFEFLDFLIGLFSWICVSLLTIFIFVIVGILIVIFLVAVAVITIEVTSVALFVVFDVLFSVDIVVVK
jgi:hypothetical protein